MATAKLPTRSPGSRPARRGAAVELEDRPRRPPTPPRALGTRARALWRELWKEPVSDLWRPADKALVVRLITLRERLERETFETPGWVYAAIAGLEDRLLLNPRVRRAAGVVYVPPAASSGPIVRRLDERRRARLERGA